MLVPKPLTPTPNSSQNSSFVIVRFATHPKPPNNTQSILNAPQVPHKASFKPAKARQGASKSSPVSSLRTFVGFAICH